MLEILETSPLWLWLKDNSEVQTQLNELSLTAGFIWAQVQISGDKFFCFFHL